MWVYILKPLSRQRLWQLASLALGLGIWLTPVPAGLAPAAWQLFAIFTASIFAVVSGAVTIFLAAVLALALSVLSGTVTPQVAYSGFSKGFILLIVVAFLVGRGIVNSGLGARIGFLLVRLFGKSSLGLAYSVIITDAVIAPAFPSNTARSGVLYPIVYSLAESSGSHPWEESRLQLGAYLMMVSMAGLGLSSGLWMTAMAANPVGVAMAAERGVEITFGSWFLASCLPTISAMVFVPWLLYRVFPPGMKATPEAPRRAAQHLQALGPMSRPEWITLATFIGIVLGWGLASTLQLDVTAIAFLGLGVLMLGGIFSLDDIKQSGDALETLIWFAIFYTLSSELDRLGFMQFVGDLLGGYVAGYSWPLTFVFLTVLYVLIHYLFVSQTAHMLALFAVFLGLSQPVVPIELMAMMLLLATNFFSVITPQGSSCNVIFVGSGYVEGKEVYRYGGLVTLACLVIYLVIGTPWILLVL
ncbi:MAG: DASS family sodium-coupled anion symporter [Halieaceae bacterium]